MQKNIQINNPQINLFIFLPICLTTVAFLDWITSERTVQTKGGRIDFLILLCRSVSDIEYTSLRSFHVDLISGYFAAGR